VVVQIRSGANADILLTLFGDFAERTWSPDDAITLGDIDADSTPDLAVGYQGGLNAQGSPTGLVIAYSGATGNELYRIYGANGGDRFGAVLLVLDDMNADGIAEFAVGAPSASNSTPWATGSISICSGIDGSIQRVITRTSQVEVGRFMDRIDDMDGDSFSDLSSGSHMQTWTVLVVFGSSRLARAAALPISMRRRKNADNTAIPLPGFQI